MKNVKDLNITIVGLGMEGGSFAIALKNYISPKNIWAIDIDEKVLRAAENLGVINKGYTDPKDVLPESDLVIICIYPSLIIDFIKDNMSYFKTNSILTDVAGVKVKIVNEVSKILRDDIDYIPGHPMAGNEHRGFIYADKSIFTGNTYILTPTETNKIENISVLEEIAESFGCSKVIKTDPETHDSMIAYASQLMHVIAVSVVNNEKFSDDVVLFSGGSFKSATRVADINPDLWTDSFMENSENLLNELEKLITNLNEFKTAIEKNDKDTIYTILNNSYKRKNEHNKKFKHI